MDVKNGFTILTLAKVFDIKTEAMWQKMLEATALQWGRGWWRFFGGKNWVLIILLSYRLA